MKFHINIVCETIFFITVGMYIKKVSNCLLFKYRLKKNSCTQIKHKVLRKKTPNMRFMYHLMEKKARRNTYIIYMFAKKKPK